MGSSNPVLEISSDEEADSVDNFDWVSGLLNESVEPNDDVIVLNPKQSFESSITALKPLVKDLDDDCVILDFDPDKPVEIENDRANESDDLLVVSEKGQVACRDYPHPRYLCANFPFSSTPHESYCDQCHCYICDSVAPCRFWVNGTPKTDHCHATGKDQFWKLLRKCWKNSDTAPHTPPSMGPPQMYQVPPFPPPLTNYVPPNPIRPTPVPASSMSPPMGVPNILTRPRNRRPGYIIPQNKFQPCLPSQQLLSKCTNIIPRDIGHNFGNLGPRFISRRLPFKRTGPVGVALQTNQCEYSSSNDTRRSRYSKNPVNSRDSGGLPSQPNAAYGFVAQHQVPLEPNAVTSLPQVHSQPYVGPVYGYFQPQEHSLLVGDSNNGHNGSQLRNQTQSVCDPSFTDFDLIWVQAENSELHTASHNEFTGSTNTGSSGFEFGSRGRVNQLNILAPNRAVIDPRTIFDY